MEGVWACLRWRNTGAPGHARGASGVPGGMYEMGRIYQQGTGVRQGYRQARTWYERAAKKGLPDAMNRLGDLYQNGWGVKRDPARAAYWYGRARQAAPASAS